MIIVGCIVIVFIGGFLWFRRSKVQEQGDAQTNVLDTKDVSKMGGDGGQPNIQIISTTDIPRPDLKKAMIPSGVISEAVKARTTTKVSEITASLEKNPRDTDKWLELGLYAEIYTDYQRAKEIYMYVIKVDPNGYTAYHNLGNLYRLYLKDYEKAEANMKVVLDLRPNYIAEYISLSDLYRYDYQIKQSLADDILLQGLAKNPKSTDLMVYLASLYSDMGDKARAREYYQKALALSPKNATAIQQDLDALGN